MKNYSKFVGLDVHKAEISVAIANVDRGEAVYYGKIENTSYAYLKLAKKLSKGGKYCSVMRPGHADMKFIGN